MPADGSATTFRTSAVHEAERDTETELRSVPGTTLDDAQLALDALKLVAKEIVDIAQCIRLLRLHDLTEYGQEPAGELAARLAEVFAEGANLKRSAAGLLNAYVADAVQ